MKVLGICAGNGVILHPFHRDSTFEVIGNIEPRGVFHTKCSSQWKSNFGDIPIFKRADDYEATLGRPKVDVIVGHPDCGHSSILSFSRAKKFGNPKDNASLTLFSEKVKEYNPKLFLLENLTQMLTQIGEDDWKRHFSKHRLIFIKTSVASFGNSQVSRERLVIIGVRKTVPPSKAKKFSRVKKVAKLKTEKQLLGKLVKIGNIPELGHVREPDSTVVCMEWGFEKLNLAQVRKAWNTRLKGQKNWDATQTGKGRMKTLPGVYRNLADVAPRTARKQNRQFNHLGNMMSARELARIQGLPDDFVIYYDENNSGYWINKGRVSVTKTPPYEVGMWFKKTIKRIITKSKANAD